MDDAHAPYVSESQWLQLDARELHGYEIPNELGRAWVIVEVLLVRSHDLIERLASRTGLVVGQLPINHASGAVGA